MSSVLPLIAVIVTVIAGWALIKRVQTHMVLLFAGLAILICVALAGTGFLPKGVKPSGFWLFDHLCDLEVNCHQAEFGHRLSYHDRRRLCCLHGPYRCGQSAR